MPRLHPPHEKHCSQDPPPLGQYEYTAADVEEHTAPADSVTTSQGEPRAAHRHGAGVRGSRSSSSSSSSSSTPSSSTRSPSRPRRRRRSAEQDGDGQFEASRRKRRRLTSIPEDGDGSEVSLTIEYAQPSALPTNQTNQELSDSACSSSHDAGWFFRALDDRQTAEQTLQARTDNGRSEGENHEQASNDIAENASGGWHTGADSINTSSNSDRPPGTTSQAFEDIATRSMHTSIPPSAPSSENARDSIPSSQPEQDNEQANHYLEQHITETRDTTNPSEDADVSPPDSPEEVPARAPLSNEGLGRLGPVPRRGCVPI